MSCALQYGRRESLPQASCLSFPHCFLLARLSQSVEQRREITARRLDQATLCQRVYRGALHSMVALPDVARVQASVRVEAGKANGQAPPPAPISSSFASNMVAPALPLCHLQRVLVQLRANARRLEA